MIQGLAEMIPKGQPIEAMLTLLLTGMMEATLMLTISSQIHTLIQLWQRGLPPKSPFCNSNRVLVRYKDFKKLRVEQRLRFVRSKGLCVNCLLPGYFTRKCPKSSFCKISGCQSNHSTYLHPQRDAREPEEISPRENTNEHEVSIPDGNAVSNAQNSFISADGHCASIGADKSATALPIVPVRVKAKGSNSSTVTYAFLDSGSNTTFCSNKIVETLGIEGEKTRLSLTTLGKQNCLTRCNLFYLVSILSG